MIQIPVIDLEMNFVSRFCFSYSGLLDEDAAAAADRSAASLSKRACLKDEYVK